MTVVTRFAPSPTGFLHIGGARTALFNWLYAKRHGGKMLLRIEDTDRERSTEAAIAGHPRRADMARPRLGRRRGLPVLPRRPAPRGGREPAGRRPRLLLLCDASRSWRRCARRPAARAGRCAMTAAGATATRPRRRPASKPVIRLQGAAEGETVVEDEVQGRVVWQNKDLDDLVLLRSDGTPTYMLAVVVDDHDMDVTHVIRGDDHLTNARPPDADLPGARLGRAEHGAHPADPRAGRRQALEAPRRARRRCLSQPWATCRRPCATISCASAGATATRRSSPPRR